MAEEEEKEAETSTKSEHDEITTAVFNIEIDNLTTPATYTNLCTLIDSLRKKGFEDVYIGPGDYSGVEEEGWKQPGCIISISHTSHIMEHNEKITSRYPSSEPNFKNLIKILNDYKPKLHSIGTSRSNLAIMSLDEKSET